MPLRSEMLNSQNHSSTLSQHSSAGVPASEWYTDPPFPVCWGRLWGKAKLSLFQLYWECCCGSHPHPQWTPLWVLLVCSMLLILLLLVTPYLLSSGINPAVAITPCSFTADAAAFCMLRVLIIMPRHGKAKKKKERKKACFCQPVIKYICLANRVINLVDVLGSVKLYWTRNLVSFVGVVTGILGLTDDYCPMYYDNGKDPWQEQDQALTIFRFPSHASSPPSITNTATILLPVLVFLEGWGSFLQSFLIPLCGCDLGVYLPEVLLESLMKYY